MNLKNPNSWMKFHHCSFEVEVDVEGEGLEGKEWEMVGAIMHLRVGNDALEESQQEHSLVVEHFVAIGKQAHHMHQL